MNPSKANVNISDSTVNKLIDFFYDYQGHRGSIKDITICNVLPVYASNTESAITKIRTLHAASVLEEVQKTNEEKLTRKMGKKDLVVLAWGKPGVKTIPNLLYYKTVLRIVDILSIIHEENLYVLDVKNASSTFTEHGDPRHAGRSVTLTGLKK